MATPKCDKTKKRCRETSARKLLEAGAEVFSKYGYDGATTKLVAQCAGINESLINRYFEGKAGLLLAIIRQFSECEASDESINSYPAGDTLEKEILNYFRASLSHHEEREEFMRVLLSRAMVDKKISQEMSRQMQCKGGLPRLHERLKAFKARGLIRSDVDLETAAFAIRGQAFSLAFISHIVLGAERDFILRAMKEFAKTYAAGLAK